MLNNSQNMRMIVPIISYFPVNYTNPLDFDPIRRYNKQKKSTPTVHF